MIRVSPLMLGLLLPAVATAQPAPLPSKPAAAPKMLVWTYPCNFAYYPDGTPYEKTPKILECDWMRKNMEKAADQFNSEPTPEAQQRMLQDMLPQADQAIQLYQSQQVGILQQTDPKQLPEFIPNSDRMSKLLEFRNQLYGSATKACNPFLWQQREEASYLVNKSNGGWPDSWKPCMGPFEPRLNELNAQITSSANNVVQSANSQLQYKLKSQNTAAGALNQAAQGVQNGPSAQAQLAQTYNNDSNTRQFPANQPGQGAAPQLQGGAAGAPSAAPTSFVPDGPNLPPLPSSKGETATRNYFSRGYEAGIDRISDDAHLEELHATGQSRTIGDPYGKTSLVFHQEGPSCDVASQEEALRERGKNVSMTALAEQGIDHGWYAEEVLSNGARTGGTRDGDLDKLLVNNGVKAAQKNNATPQDLDAAIRKSGDAIVAVHTAPFWNDTNISPNSGHAVYVTGEEVDNNNKVLGYYFNDTGTGEAARYVSQQDFLRAWKNEIVMLPPASATR